MELQAKIEPMLGAVPYNILNDPAITALCSNTTQKITWLKTSAKGKPFVGTLAEYVISRQTEKEPSKLKKLAALFKKSEEGQALINPTTSQLLRRGSSRGSYHPFTL